MTVMCVDEAKVRNGTLKIAFVKYWPSSLRMMAETIICLHKLDVPFFPPPNPPLLSCPSIPPLGPPLNPSRGLRSLTAKLLWCILSWKSRLWWFECHKINNQQLVKVLWELLIIWLNLGKSYHSETPRWLYWVSGRQNTHESPIMFDGVLQINRSSFQSFQWADLYVCASVCCMFETRLI